MLTRAEALKRFAAWGGALLLGGADYQRHGPRRLMGSFFVPASSGIENGFTITALSAGQTASGLFYTTPFPFVIGTAYPLTTAPTSDGPNIMQRWQILAFYLPIAVNGSGFSTTPATCVLTLSAMVNGETRWANSQTIPLLDGSGSVLVSDDLVNPFELTAGQRLTFGYSIRFDQTLGGVDPYSVAIGLSTTTLGNNTFEPASVRYAVNYDRRLPGRG